MFLSQASQEDGTIKGIANQLNSAFIDDGQELLEALALMGIDGIEDFLVRSRDFLLMNANITSLTIDEVSSFDLKRMSYDLIAALKIPKPVFPNPQAKAVYLDVMAKLARLYIHEILFPELIAVNPNLAYSTLNLVKGMVRSIAITEGMKPKEAFDILLLDEIEIPAVNQLTYTQKKNVHLTLKEYIEVNNATPVDIDKVAEFLKDNDAISKKSAFIRLLTYNGIDLEPMEINSRKLKLVIHLFYRMFHRIDKHHKPILAMSTGKGFWQFLQQNLIDDSGNIIERDLRKISSEINKNPGHDHIHAEVKYILDPIYQRQKK